MSTNPSNTTENAIDLEKTYLIDADALRKSLNDTDPATIRTDWDATIHQAPCDIVDFFDELDATPRATACER